MKKERVVVAAHHGSHDHDHYLTKCGIRQMKDLAAAVKKVATKRDLNVKILASTEQASFYGAHIVANELGMRPEQVESYNCFCLEAPHAGDFQASQKIIEDAFQEGILLILISDAMLTNRIVRYVAGLIGMDGKSKEPPHGTGYMIAQKGVSVIPRPAVRQ